jgi:hypothetical protein
MSDARAGCDVNLARSVVEDAESLAARLHHFPSERSEERRGALQLFSD